MPLYNPAHPGRLVRMRLFDEDEGCHIGSIVEAAELLGCHRNTLNKVLNGSASITPEMALALEQIGAGTAEFWLSVQSSYDLFVLRQAKGVA